MGSGLTPDGRFLADTLEHDTFNFSKFKEITSDHHITATSFYRSGGKTQTQQGYSLIYLSARLSSYRLSYIQEHTIIQRKLSDLNLILSFKNKMKRKSGVSFGIEIKFDLFTKFR